MSNARDMKGFKSGLLTVIGRDGSIRGNAAWLCLCECGNETTIVGYSLTAKRPVISCGCLKNKKTHGMTDSPEYRAWRAMRSRCNDKNHKAFKNYGGRGIKVCPEWENSFEAFYKDMGAKPLPNLQIDRIDNNKGYSKENCRWATRSEQNRNTRKQEDDMCGISRLPGGAFRASIGIDGKTKHVGSFTTKEKAKEYRDNLLRFMFGEYEQ